MPAPLIAPVPQLFLGLRSPLMNPLDLLYGSLAIFLAPVWARKARGGWRERFGNTPELPQPTPERPRIMIHAVSVGEVNAIRGLVPLLAARAHVIVSVTTDTGLARARELFEPSVTHVGTAAGVVARATVLRYPLDFSRSVDRFLDAVQPTIVGLVELEVWPNFIAACARRNIGVGVINGRLSERSFKGYRRIRRWIRSSFERLSFAAVQDRAYAERFLAMGVPPERLHMTDSMKWDSAKFEDQVNGSADLAGQLGIDRARPLIVAGSTGPGEEAMLHARCPRGVQLLCAPRKPERFDAAAAAMPGCIRRSANKSAAASAPANSANPAHSEGPKPDRFLLDTIGELRAAYAIADVVIVGRSFGKLYGSDPIEPVSLGKATLIGPAYKDFDSIVRALDAAGGIRIVSQPQLASVLQQLLATPSDRAEMATKGRACIQQRRGATERHASMLLDLARAHTGPLPSAGKRP